jgi:hypothetical protein
MSCPVDRYYETGIVPQGATCGDCKADYNKCGRTATLTENSTPSCCPPGYHYVDTTPCGDCTFKNNAGLATAANLLTGNLLNSVVPMPGRYFRCAPDEPQMNTYSKVNCCINKNLKKDRAEGYCAKGWCPGSSSCISFMTSYCQEDRLDTMECVEFCKKNTGKCDAALLKYCKNPENFAKPVCGCALPSDQYTLNKLRTPTGEAVPISCDYRCGTIPEAIRLAGQQDCKIGAVCVQNFKDVEIHILQKQLPETIKIIQSCGNAAEKEGQEKIPEGIKFSGTNIGIEKKTFWEKYKFIILAAVIILIIMIVIILLF